MSRDQFAPPTVPDRPAAGPAVITEYDGDKPASEIEEDIARTRGDLSETLDALEHKLAPRQLLEKGVDMLRDSMDGNWSQVTETIRANPVPLALIGAGLGWLLLSRTGGTEMLGNATRSAREQLGRGMSAAADRAGALGGSIAERAGALAGRIGDAAGGAVDRVKDMARSDHGETEYSTGEGSYAYARPKSGNLAGYGAEARERLGKAASSANEMAQNAASAIGAVQARAGDYARSAREQYEMTRDRVADAMERYPLAVGAVGFVAGAALAMLLPTTRSEDRYFGETRDQMLDRVRETGRAAAERAGEVVGDTADAALQATKQALGGEKPADTPPKPEPMMGSTHGVGGTGGTPSGSL
jgi:Protein of unknown function (DUF3618)